VPGGAQIGLLWRQPSALRRGWTAAHALGGRPGGFERGGERL